MSLKWIYKPEPDEEIVDSISSSIGFGTLESKILVLRGIDDYQKAREFFKPKLEDIHSPFLMADMQKAVERIASAIENGEKILLETQQKVTIQRTVDIYKQYRKELGLTQSELGKRAGISQPNITRFESGNYNPSLEFLVKIAGAMGKKVKVTLED